MIGVTRNDVERMRDELFFEGPSRGRKLSRFWLLLVPTSDSGPPRRGLVR